MNQTYEFDHNGKPLVSWFGQFASDYLLLALKLLCFVVPITLGIKYTDALLISRLIKISAIVMGFLTSIIAWLFALLIPWFVLGTDYDFVTEVYQLHSLYDFSVPASLVYLAVLIFRPLIRILNRSVTSYLYRKIVFVIATFILVACFMSIDTFIKATHNPGIYAFNFAVLAIIYFRLMASGRPSRLNRPDDLYINQSHLNMR